MSDWIKVFAAIYLGACGFAVVINGLNGIKFCTGIAVMVAAMNLSAFACMYVFGTWLGWL